jgi:hypothetical protein
MYGLPKLGSFANKILKERLSSRGWLFWSCSHTWLFQILNSTNSSPKLWMILLTSTLANNMLNAYHGPSGINMKCVQKIITKYNHQSAKCLQICPYYHNSIKHDKSLDEILHEIKSSPLYDTNKKDVYQVLGRRFQYMPATDMKCYTPSLQSHRNKPNLQNIQYNV